MKRPLIGVSGSRDEEKRTSVVRENYFEAILRAGGLPVLLPAVQTKEEAEAYLDELDGLLLSGGVDLDPTLYGEACIADNVEIDARRDAFEMLLIPGALERRMPIFGICRGIQALSAVMGCTLIQDIEMQRGIPRAKHYQQPPYNQPLHHVRFVSGGLLEKIVGSADMEVNSTHHQAVKEVSDRLIVEGMSDDGIIEAVRSVDNDAVFGVQFHPEHLAANCEKAQRLFDYFVSTAVQYAGNK